MGINVTLVLSSSFFVSFQSLLQIQEHMMKFSVTFKFKVDTEVKSASDLQEHKKSGQSDMHLGLTKLLLYKFHLLMSNL